MIFYTLVGQISFRDNVHTLRVDGHIFGEVVLFFLRVGGIHHFYGAMITFFVSFVKSTKKPWNGSDWVRMGAPPPLGNARILKAPGHRGSPSIKSLRVRKDSLKKNVSFGIGHRLDNLPPSIQASW